jgi:poly [ADP-ribose] polymerase 10/14/15
MELFHGTRNTPPSEIYDGEHGFDTTFCSAGLWGIGTYFAKNASYSCSSYSHLLPNGKRQIFLVQVLTGDVYDYKQQNDQTLRRPPKKTGRTPTTYYDSVSGETGGSQVYIVYYPNLAYPTFLITYTA